MDCSLHNSKGRLALTLAVLGLLGVGAAFAGDKKGQKIEFSDPVAGSQTTTNMGNLESGNSKLKPIERDSFRPSDFFQPQNDALTHFRPPVQQHLDKHTLEQLQKRRNWAFTDSELLSPNATMESMMGLKSEGADTLQKKSLSPVEKYYESLNPKQKPSNNPGAENFEMNQARELSGTNGMDRFQSGSDSAQKNVFSKEYQNPFAQEPANSVATFGSPAFIQSKRDQLQLQHRQDFEKILTNTPSTPIVNPYADQAGFAQHPNSALIDNSQPLQPHYTLSPFQGVAASPKFHSQTTMDPTAKALGLTDPSFLPKPEAAPKTPPPSAFVNPLFKRSF
ncbi:hypothetical protein [Pedosphaera parvula]|uniref:Uncharacterized protein n=1 Tax=Pedosphaera parvula (strain Ellin514) TaxID=320771 RepID=B9XRT1_PEDPL|nr:hypothetical protein [Pedosphaera parvula]EEF57442.1 hypothetical protein Cflav_PD0553 [Pedosphaera parvula Ellin514]